MIISAPNIKKNNHMYLVLIITRKHRKVYIHMHDTSVQNTNRWERHCWWRATILGKSSWCAVNASSSRSDETLAPPAGCESAAALSSAQSSNTSGGTARNAPLIFIRLWWMVSVMRHFLGLADHQIKLYSSLSMSWVKHTVCVCWVRARRVLLKAVTPQKQERDVSAPRPFNCCRTAVK